MWCFQKILMVNSFCGFTNTKNFFSAHVSDTRYGPQLYQKLHINFPNVALHLSRLKVYVCKYRIV